MFINKLNTKKYKNKNRKKWREEVKGLPWIDDDDAKMMMLIMVKQTKLRD